MIRSRQDSNPGPLGQNSNGLITEHKSRLPDAVVRDWLYTQKLCMICFMQIFVTHTQAVWTHIKTGIQNTWASICLSTITYWTKLEESHIYWAKVITQLWFILIVSFSRACIKPIISPKLKFNQSSILPHTGFNNLFPTVQETVKFMKVGWLEKWNEWWSTSIRHTTCISCNVKDVFISEISFRNSLHF